MSQRVCPWWIGYLLACPVRKLMQDPAKILSPYIQEGMTVLEPGPGMGFFTVEMAKMVGASGRVIAVDIQPKMVSALRRRVARAGLLNRIETRLVPPESLGVRDLAGTVDFTLAFALVHEMPSAQTFFKEVAAVSKPGALVLLAEPTGHVTLEAFEDELKSAAAVGLATIGRPEIRSSHAAILRRV